MYYVVLLFGYLVVWLIVEACAIFHFSLFTLHFSLFIKEENVSGFPLQGDKRGSPKISHKRRKQRGKR